jgi:hypothetical protein
MQYLLMIYHVENETRPTTEAAAAAMHAAYGKFTNDIKASGHFLGGNGLQPVSAATTIRVRDGKTITTDGPFAETREQLGGYYLIEAAHLDEAIAIATRIPGARNGSIEIRPIFAVAAA